MHEVKVKSLSCVWLFETPWTVAHQAPPSMGFSRQEYWNGLPFPFPGDLPDPGIEPGSPTLQADALTSEPPGKPRLHINKYIHTHIYGMPSNHLILCCPLLLPPSIFTSIRVFSNESVLCMMWPKYWSFSFSISPSNKYLGLISFRMDWLDLLAVQGTLKSLLQHHSSKASILRSSVFIIVQLSYPYRTTGKTTALTRLTFVDKVTSLLF